MDARDNLKHNPFPTANTPEGGTSEGRSPARYTIRNSGTPKGGDKRVPCVTNMFDKGRFQGSMKKSEKIFDKGFSPARAGEYLH